MTSLNRVSLLRALTAALLALLVSAQPGPAAAQAGVGYQRAPTPKIHIPEAKCQECVLVRQEFSNAVRELERAEKKAEEENKKILGKYQRLGKERQEIMKRVDARARELFGKNASYSQLQEIENKSSELQDVTKRSDALEDQMIQISANISFLEDVVQLKRGRLYNCNEKCKVAPKDPALTAPKAKCKECKPILEALLKTQKDMERLYKEWEIKKDEEEKINFEISQHRKVLATRTRKRLAQSKINYVKYFIDNQILRAYDNSSELIDLNKKWDVIFKQLKLFNIEFNQLEFKSKRQKISLENCNKRCLGKKADKLPPLPDPFPVTVTADRPQIKPPELPDPFAVTVTAERPQIKLPELPDPFPVTVTAERPGGKIACIPHEYPRTAELPPGTFDAITVGANSDFGSGGKLQEKLTETVGGALGGFLGGGLPGMGGGGGGQKPELATDPVPGDNKILLTDAATGTQIQVGMVPTQHGMQVSSTIVNAPGDGTFQTIYMQDSQGRKAGPISYAIYELYLEWKLTVNWTYDRWVDGEHVEHREGGWSESGTELLDTFSVPTENDGIWNKLGFSTATQGVKGLGTLFPVGRELLQSTPMSLVIHVTQPDKDPVTTIPFVISVPPCPELPMTVARKQVQQRKPAPAEKLDTLCEINDGKSNQEGISEDRCDELDGEFTSW